MSEPLRAQQRDQEVDEQGERDDERRRAPRRSCALEPFEEEEQRGEDERREEEGDEVVDEHAGHARSRRVKGAWRFAGAGSRSREDAVRGVLAGVGLRRAARRSLLDPAAAPRRAAATRAGSARRASRTSAPAVVDCGVLRRGAPAGRPGRARDRAQPAPTRAATASSGSASTTPAPRSSRRWASASSCTRWRSRTRVHAHQRPKLEVFGDTLFLVLKTARHVNSAEPVEIGEVMVFVGPRFVVTVRHGEGSPLHDVRLDLEAHPDLLGIGPSSVLYAVADRIVDDYAEVLERLALEVDAVEADVFAGTGANPTERDLQAQARGARVQARGGAAGRARCSGSPTDQAGLPARPAHRRLLPRRQRPPRCATPSGSPPSTSCSTGVLQANFAQLDRARQPGPAQDLELGRDRRGADDDLRPLRHELRAHARARVAVRLPADPGRRAGDLRHAAPRLSSAPAGSRRRSGSRRPASVRM